MKRIAIIAVSLVFCFTNLTHAQKKKSKKSDKDKAEDKDGDKDEDKESAKA